MRTAKALGLGLFLLLSLATAAHAEPAPAAATHMIASRGTRIAFHVTPGRGPTIVLDAGGGSDSSYWNAIVPELAKRTGARIIIYDRAGFGQSDERKGPFRIEDAVADLANGLRKLGATRDIILVSHSFAGEIATYFARKHPGWISGAVLVDANIPPFFTDAALARQAAAYAPMIAAMRAAPDQTKQSRSMLALFDAFVPIARAFHRVPWPKKVPCTVIVSETTPFDTAIDAGLWRDAQAQFARAAKNRRLIVAKGSSHDVARDRPDLIVQAVVDMAAQIR